MSRKVFMIMAILCLIGAGIFTLFRSNDTGTVNISLNDESRQKEQAVLVSAEGRYLFSGTIVLARAVENLALDAQGNRDYAQPFSKLESFNPELYDAWATDFECPITDAFIPYRTQVESLVFNCRPEFLPELTKYFTLFNLANNHTGDQAGQVGLESTRQYLEAAGVQHYGHFDPSIVDDICEVIGLPVRLQFPGQNQQDALLPVAFCSWHYFNDNRYPTDAELAIAKKYAQYMPVFGFVEMGTEYQAEASADQVAIAHSIIDAGAEFVFANNPHWVQNSEVYKGKLIVYSLGNFIFDQIEPETLRGVSIDTKLRIEGSAVLTDWLELAKSCTPNDFKDNCLEQAIERNLSKLSISLNYDAVANTSGYRVVTEKADERTQAAVKDRLRWSESMEALMQATETYDE